MKIIRYSALVAMSSILWTLGLTLCGALRTILLWEHSEIALLAAVSVITTLSHEKVWLSYTRSFPSSTLYFAECTCTWTYYINMNVITVTINLIYRVEEQFSWFLGLSQCCCLTMTNPIFRLSTVSQRIRMLCMCHVEFRCGLFAFLLNHHFREFWS